MASENDDYKEFICNTLLIKALMQFLSINDRLKVKVWLHRLEQITEGAEIKTRNDYAFYLLINTQNGTLSEPFSCIPPEGQLTPLCRILPDAVYEEVVKQLRVSFCRINKMLNEPNENESSPALYCEPARFQHEQPKPKRGVTAYCAAFSSYPDTGREDGRGGPTAEAVDGRNSRNRQKCPGRQPGTSGYSRSPDKAGGKAVKGSNKMSDKGLNKTSNRTPDRSPDRNPGIRSPVRTASLRPMKKQPSQLEKVTKL